MTPTEWRAARDRIAVHAAEVGPCAWCEPTEDLKLTMPADLAAAYDVIREPEPVEEFVHDVTEEDRIKFATDRGLVRPIVDGAGNIYDLRFADPDGPPREVFVATASEVAAWAGKTVIRTRGRLVARRLPRRPVAQRRPSRSGSTRRRVRVASTAGGGSRAPGDDDPPLPAFDRAVAVYRELLPAPVVEVWAALAAVGVTPKSGTDGRVRRDLRVRARPSGYQGGWVDEFPEPDEFVLRDRIGRVHVRTLLVPGETRAEQRVRHLQAKVAAKEEESLRRRILGDAA